MTSEWSRDDLRSSRRIKLEVSMSCGCCQLCSFRAWSCPHPLLLVLDLLTRNSMLDVGCWCYQWPWYNYYTSMHASRSLFQASRPRGASLIRFASVIKEQTWATRHLDTATGCLMTLYAHLHKHDQALLFSFFCHWRKGLLHSPWAFDMSISY